ncbi:MAG: aminoglycoside phosphotransferase family protein, partial [Anaerolineae bacterium]|nr:aminoglycoside phosphotransferase family protein [Anaerolineae bacterium]
MLEKPNLSDEKIIASLREAYGIEAAALEFLPIGNDATAWAYRVEGQGGAAYFLKVKKGAVYETSVTIPHFLRNHGIDQVVAPRQTQIGRLWAEVETFALILYPFIDGWSGMEAGLSEAQWIELGAILRKMHSLVLPAELAGQVRRETFIPSWAAMVKEFDAKIPATTYENPYARELAAFWTERAAEIRRIVMRTEELGRMLQERGLPFVLCHADIHRANVLVDVRSAQGGLHIVDWDQTIFAPKERDLMFMIGEGGEAAFYGGYGDTAADRTALAYYRYEWVVQEIGDFGKRVFISDDVGDETRADSVRGFRQL